LARHKPYKSLEFMELVFC